MIVHAVCRCLTGDLLDGIHQPRDDYRVALYTEKAQLDASTTKYTPQHEAESDEYPPGGISTDRVRRSSGDGEHLSVRGVVIKNTDLKAAGALVYNATKNRALFVLSFGEPRESRAGNFEVQIPDDLFTLPFGDA